MQHLAHCMLSRKMGRKIQLRAQMLHAIVDGADREFRLLGKLRNEAIILVHMSRVVVQFYMRTLPPPLSSLPLRCRVHNIGE